MVAHIWLHREDPRPAAVRGVPLWLTVYPYGHQISPREWNDGRVDWSFEQNRVYTTAPQKQVEELGRSRGFP